ncbi:M1 family metallopeptidase [Ekhidna sp.]|uniref:M1 family metallopeptidase n=1 Tax=Ekhidna sp. TaxID=2608089 RepID=UPI003B5059E8
MRTFIALILLSFSISSFGQDVPGYSGKFNAIDRLLEPPSPYRTASGAPGEDYWQQRADYKIKASIDENTNELVGEETITYYNNSPHNLKFLWLNIEQNVNRKGNEDFGDVLGGVQDSISSLQIQYLLRPIDFPAGTDIQWIKDASGKPLDYIVNNTLLRINLPEPLKSGENVSFSIKWKNYITDRAKFLLSREGYEYFPEDDNKVFLLGHWFPRMAVYNDTEGWQNKQFRRLGEFALEFGDYEVALTVPADHIVAGTGTLVNESEVLTKTQKERLDKARKSFEEQLFIITPDEAKANEKTKKTETKTWKFKAENVRDVAFASSRKFIWDAMAVKLPTNTVLAMSFYPKEGTPVWTEESTNAIKQALEVYSEATFDYPYPTAISVNTSNIGMEFPMISFNGGRPMNGQISEQARRGMTSTIIHEVGHNWFPMIVSSDERKWMWMDEGLNTFLHQRTLAERYPQWSSTRPKDIVPFMMGDQKTLRPIMTNSDNDLLFQMGANFYQKPTVGLQMLRETIVGKELFDEAFKEYANRWKYKHPNPSDFFRTLEDGTATDLDWFFKGWFFTTETVDIDLAEVKWFQLKDEVATVENKDQKGNTKRISGSGNAEDGMGFGEGPQPFAMAHTPDGAYGQFLSRIDESQMREQLSGKHIYELTFKNKGGLVMPVIIEWTYADGTKEVQQLPAEIWRLNEAQVTKTFLKEKEVVNIAIDPNQQIPDVNMNNNVFPRTKQSDKFENMKDE